MAGQKDALLLTIQNSCCNPMRYLLDTNIFVYAATDRDFLDPDVKALLNEPDALLYISAESVKELIVGYRNKGLCSRRWKTEFEMVKAIEDEFFITILPVTKEHMETYAHMTLNEAMGHKDPSDHIIIAHAMTEHMPLVSSDTRFDFYRKQGFDLIFNKK